MPPKAAAAAAPGAEPEPIEEAVAALAEIGAALRVTRKHDFAIKYRRMRRRSRSVSRAAVVTRRRRDTMSRAVVVPTGSGMGAEGGTHQCMPRLGRTHISACRGSNRGMC